MKDTLVIMCSGTGFTTKVLNSLCSNLNLDEDDYDLLAVPGGIHSLAITAFLPKFRWVVQRSIRFLVEEHQLKRIVVIDHDDCAWFKKLAISEPSVIGKAQHYSLDLAIKQLSSLAPNIVLEVWRISRINDEINFEKVK